MIPYSLVQRVRRWWANKAHASVCDPCDAPEWLRPYSDGGVFVLTYENPKQMLCICEDAFGHTRESQQIVIRYSMIERVIYPNDKRAEPSVLRVDYDGGKQLMLEFPLFENRFSDSWNVGRVLNLGSQRTAGMVPPL